MTSAHVPIFVSYGKTLRLERALEELKCPPASLALKGTVKLHGANLAAVLLDGLHSTSSRRRQLTPKFDPMGFRRFAIERAAGLADMETMLRRLFKVAPSAPLRLSGEFCGPGIQKYGAMAALPRRVWIVFSATVLTRNEQGEWAPQRHLDLAARAPTAPLSMPLDLRDVHFITAFSTFDLVLPTTAPKPALREAELLAERIGAQCPVARALAGVDGPGEGIVWTAFDAATGERLLLGKTKSAAFVQTSHASQKSDFAEMQEISRMQKHLLQSHTRNGWTICAHAQGEPR